MISKFFIERPVLSNVIAIVIVFLGVIAMKVLPVSQYPEIVPPTIQVTTTYPGADAKTLIKTVALPIEKQVNGVEDMLYMQSTNTNGGNYTLIITFKIGTDMNFAQVLVQSRVQAAMAQLPDSVQKQGVVVQKKSTAVLQFVTLSAKNGEYDGLFLNNYATINMQNELARLPGVGNVGVFGAGTYAMRVWLDPKKMYAYSLNPSDVLNAISNQNKQVSAGQIGGPPDDGKQAYQFTVNVPGQIADVDKFGDIIVKSDATNPNQTAKFTNTKDSTRSARIIRIRDVGRVELGASSYNQFATLNNKPTAAIAIYQLPEANALDVAKTVRETVAKMAEKFPPGLEYNIPFDTTVFVKASIDEVYHTLYEAGFLVLLVILLFLQNSRATLVPATTVPVTIIGAFFAMLLLSYSINLLTLFALVLAIGIVIDDAIVIVEGVTQKIEQKHSPKKASILAMSELMGPIIGITLVLMAVFVPAGFIPGLTGAMYAQFALVIAATAFISAINAVSLKPTQCAMWLTPVDENKRKNIVFRTFDNFYYPLEKRYIHYVEDVIHRSGKMCLIGGVLVLLAIIGLTRIPTGFVPIEDQGYMMLNVQLPDGASLERTKAMLGRLTTEVEKLEAVKNVVGIAGISLLDNSATLANGGTLYIVFKDWGRRGKHGDLRSLYDALSDIAKKTLGAKVMAVVPPPIQGLGLSGGYQMQVQLTDGSFDYEKLQNATDALLKEAEKRPELENLMTSFRARAPQLSAPIDRQKAESLGVSVGDATNALETYLGSSYVNLFAKFGQVFQVYVQADADSRMTIDDVRNYYVRNDKGEMVPLGTLTDMYSDVGPSIISLYNLYPSSNIYGMAASGYSSGQAIDVLEQLAHQILPKGMSFEWTGTAYQEKVAGNMSYYIFMLSLILVYLILAGQYENWVTSLSVIFSVPLALVGTVLVLLVLKISNNMYTQIGILLLIALAAKNAILIVEVAREERELHHKSIIEAALTGARIRFRPILMTSFAFILGMMPLVFASGAGANARRSIGIAVSSGMLASTCLSVIFVPVFYVTLQTLQERFWPKKVAEPDGSVSEA
ncbi:MAG: efflux RND transporter permease subunit [Legionellaceae bacterium]|nr:efflux RND transporter permease subunit [Legionellaceae bacterium]